MHVVFATPAFPPFPGGGERYAASLATQLVDMGHQVTVVTSAATTEQDLWQGAAHTAESEEGLLHVIRCPVRPVPGRWRGLLAWRKAMVLYSALPGSQAGMLLRMARRVPPIQGLGEAFAALDRRVDLVHGFNISWEHALVAGWQFARQRGVPFVVTPFAHLGNSERSRVALNSTMDHQRYIMSDAEALMALTAVEVSGLQRHGVNPRRVKVLGGGLDPFPAIVPADDVLQRHDLQKPFVLFVGRANYDKGSIHAAQALLALRAEGRNQAQLVVVGQQTDEFKRFYQKLPDAGKSAIRVLGLVDEADKHALLEEAELLMLPSRSDSFGIVMLEAWAHGKPVIAANAGGIPAVVDDGANGLLVPFGDVSGLTAALAKLLDDARLRQRLGYAGREKVRIHYNWRAVAERVVDCYEQVAH